MLLKLTMDMIHWIIGIIIYVGLSNLIQKAEMKVDCMKQSQNVFLNTKMICDTGKIDDLLNYS